MSADVDQLARVADHEHAPPDAELRVDAVGLQCDDLAAADRAQLGQFLVESRSVALLRSGKRAAAEALNGDGMAGFVGANAPADAFTEQTFEHIALGNTCQLVDDAGEATFASPECVEALDFYGNLIQNYSVSGNQDVDTVRANYFAGEAAMMIWSTFILDELAGLRDDALPTCEECADDPGWLAENSGIVTSISGPSGTGKPTPCADSSICSGV